MSTRLREQQETERLETLVEIARLDLWRHLNRAGATHLEKAAVRAQLAERLAEEAGREASCAVAEGESYSAVARALGVSRQAVSKRYRHLEVVS